MEVYRMDDYEWYAGESLDQCMEYFEEITGEKYEPDQNELNPYPNECDIDKEGVWVEIETDETFIPIQQKIDEYTIGDRKFYGYSNCEFMSFRKCHESQNKEFPYCIASTEV